MSQTVRTFRAATAEEALAQVRREMGLDAVVVEVKQVTSRGLFAWLSSRPQVEVKAGRPANARRAERPAEQRSRSEPTNTGTIAAAAASKLTQGAARTPIAAANTAGAQRAHAASVAVNQSRVPEHSQGRSRAPEMPSTTSNRVPATLSELAPPPPLLPPLPTPSNRIAAALRTAPAPLAPAFTEPRPQPAAPVSREPALRNNQPSVTARSESSPSSLPGIEQRLDALHQMIADLGRRTQPRGLVEIPPELFPHYLALVEADVEDELARELIQSLHRHAAAGQLADSAATMALLTALIEQRVPCDRLLSVAAGRRQIAMVVGPTGVGKTTTLAKLAAQFGVEQGLRLGLITVDTYRVAAVEQLRTYAEIIDLPMRVVASADEMQVALDAFIDCDLVLIDTAGRSPHDDRKLAELKQLIDAACPDHVYLVLSLASGANALRSAAERFSSIRPTSLVLTKLDEAAGCGGLLSAARDIGLPISYFTTGQEVPRDIEPANPCRAARLIIGADCINRLARR